MAAAREATYARVRREMEANLDPRVEEVTASILREIPLMVAGAHASAQRSGTGG